MNTAIVKSALPFINLGFAWCDRCNTAIAPTQNARVFHERRCDRVNGHRSATSIAPGILAGEYSSTTGEQLALRTFGRNKVISP